MKLTVNFRGGSVVGEMPKNCLLEKNIFMIICPNEFEGAVTVENSWVLADLKFNKNQVDSRFAGSLLYLQESHIMFRVPNNFWGTLTIDGTNKEERDELANAA